MSGAASLRTVMSSLLRETLHADSLRNAGKSFSAAEWLCPECRGLFVRRDSLADDCRLDYSVAVTWLGFYRVCVMMGLGIRGNLR